MISIKQLSLYLSSNNLSYKEVETNITEFAKHVYSRAVENTHSRINSIKRKRRGLTSARMKKDFDIILVKLRDPSFNKESN